MDGYDGGGDILHRLEEGDPDQYIKPLFDYVSGRIGSERKDLKNPRSIVVDAFNFPSFNSRRKAGELAQNRTFLYPLDIHGWPDYQRPLDHPVIPTYINEAFFSQNLYSGIIKQYGTFSSSDSKKPDELEVPKGMVTLAAAAIYACLQDHATATKDPFPNKDVNGVWHLAVELLEKLENAKPSKYHNLMHNIYKQATEKRGYQHVTNLQVLQATDWSAIEQESDEDEDSTTAEHPSIPLEPTNVHSEGCNTGTSAAAMPE
ncbi:hypothetical protein PM082_024382 [Marasmius tenuissimus]|nr:hypothetical protein PM082_024382 [Marasmius tenuissimus]